MRRALTTAVAGVVLVALVVASLDRPRRSAPDGRGAAQVGKGPLPSQAEVVSVVDGDTIRVAAKGREFRVRIIGIDTPETKVGPRPACYGNAAATRLDALVGDRRVRLRAQVEKRDRYDRWLVDVAPLSGPASGRDVAQVMVREGNARTLRIEPNTRQAARLDDLQREAQARRRGLWGACDYREAFPQR